MSALYDTYTSKVHVFEDDELENINSKKLNLENEHGYVEILADYEEKEVIVHEPLFSELTYEQRKQITRKLHAPNRKNNINELAYVKSLKK